MADFLSVEGYDVKIFETLAHSYAQEEIRAGNTRDTLDNLVNFAMDHLSAGMKGARRKTTFIGRQDGKNFVPCGFAVYFIRSCSEFKGVEEATMLFKNNPLYYSSELAQRLSQGAGLEPGPIRMSSTPLDKSKINQYAPYSQYSGAGNFAFLREIQIIEQLRRQKLGSEFFRHITSNEKIEFVEGFAVRGSFNFWRGAGAVFTGIHNFISPSIAWLNPMYQKS